MYVLIYWLLIGVLIVCVCYLVLSPEKPKSKIYKLKRGGEIETTEHFGELAKNYHNPTNIPIYYYYRGIITHVQNTKTTSLIFFTDYRTGGKCSIPEHLITPTSCHVKNIYRIDNEISKTYVEDIIKKGRL